MIKSIVLYNALEEKIIGVTFFLLQSYKKINMKQSLEIGIQI